MGKSKDTKKNPLDWKEKRVEIFSALAVVCAFILVVVFLFMGDRNQFTQGRSETSDSISSKPNGAHKINSRHQGVLVSGYEDVQLPANMMDVGNGKQRALEESQTLDLKIDLGDERLAERFERVEGNVVVFLKAVLVENPNIGGLDKLMAESRWNEASEFVAKRALFAVLGKKNTTFVVGSLHESFPPIEIAQFIQHGYENGSSVSLDKIAHSLVSTVKLFLIGEFAPQGKRGTELITTFLRSFSDDGVEHDWQAWSAFQKGLVKKELSQEERSKALEVAHGAMHQNLESPIKARAEFHRQHETHVKQRR